MDEFRKVGQVCKRTFASRQDKPMCAGAVCGAAARSRAPGRRELHPQVLAGTRDGFRCGRVSPLLRLEAA
jgi:hypothetical protein